MHISRTSTKFDHNTGAAGQLRQRKVAAEVLKDVFMRRTSTLQRYRLGMRTTQTV